MAEFKPYLCLVRWTADCLEDTDLHIYANQYHLAYKIDTHIYLVYNKQNSWLVYGDPYFWAAIYFSEKPYTRLSNLISTVNYSLAIEELKEVLKSEDLSMV